MKNKKVLIGIIAAIVLLIGGGVAWWNLYKVPHDNAVNTFNKAVSIIEEKNAEVDKSVKELQTLMDSDDEPYDQEVITNATVAIAEVQDTMIQIPEMPSGTEEINEAASGLNTDVDYSEQIARLNDCKEEYENSVRQLKQITNPSESFVVERLNAVSGVTGVQAVTEDHDPNGNLHKDGGYTSAVYFSHENVNKAEIYAEGDIVDVGTDGGGCVEVYETAEIAENRNTYLAGFDGTIYSSGSHTVLGTMVIRTSKALTATQQNELEANINSKMLELQ